MAQTECTMFEGDEVCKMHGGLMFGIVKENSEFLSDEEDDDDDDDDDNHEILRKGMVRVKWRVVSELFRPIGGNSVYSAEKENEVTLIDRLLEPGDVVRRLISGKNSQLGYVQDLEVRCLLKIYGTKKYIYNVDGRHLLPFREYDYDDDVSLDCWYGKVKTANMQARVVFPDGAQCIAEEKELHEVLLNDFEGPDEMILGIVLKGQRNDLKEVTWIHETKTNNSKMSSAENIQIRLEENLVKSVQVDWLCKAYNTTEDVSKLKMPNIVEKDQFDKLKKLGKFQHCNIKINDNMRYMIKDTDVIIDDVPGSDIITLNKINSMRSSVFISEDSSVGHHSSEHKQDSSVGHHSSEHKQDSSVVHPSSEPLSSSNPPSGPVSSKTIECPSSKNVDGTTCSQKKDNKSGVSTLQDSMMNGMKKTMEFQTKFPECKVGETVPVVVFCTVSIATVMWQDGSVEKHISSTELLPVNFFDEHEFFPGDFVVEAKEESEKPYYYGAIASCDHQARTCMVNWYKIENGVNVRTSEEPEEVSVDDIKTHPEYKFNPGDIVVAVGDPKKSDAGNHSVGQIASLESQGRLSVKWPDNTISICNPQELHICPVERDMSECDSDTE